MSVTATQVFDTAMRIAGEVDSAGLTDTADNAEYKNRTLGIINALQVRLYPYSDTYAVVTAGKRPILAPVTAFTSLLGLDDGLALGVLPYGLVAELFKDENETIANYALQVYQELIFELKNSPSEFADITDVYGGIEYSEYGRW